MVNQWNAVNNAFTGRIKEYMDAKNKLQTHLSQVGVWVWVWVCGRVYVWVCVCVEVC